ncbi:MAG TPA: GNAT family N-acetyltransferase [Steroidobacteraceae bacterium]
MIFFRPLTRVDFPLLQRWLVQPHVDPWWNQRLDNAGLEAKYGPRIDGLEPTHVFLIELNKRPVGWIQWYLWSDYPEHAEQLEAEVGTAGIDLAIGEPALVGLGLGPMVIATFLRRHIFAEPGISAVVTDIDSRNNRSLRAFCKVGFSITNSVQLRGEDFVRQTMRLPRLQFRMEARN